MANGQKNITIQKIALNQVLAAGLEANIDKDGHVGVRPHSQKQLQEWAATRPQLASGGQAHPLTTLLRSLIIK